MAYRDDLEALESRALSVENELRSVASHVRELEELTRREADLKSELADLRARIDGHAKRRTLPLLEAVRIASPCKASWDDMVGDDRVRFCGQCAKNVYNLSAMGREEAERVLREHEGNLCARLYKRVDGTVLTADCPVGVHRKRVRRAAFAVVGGGALAAAAAGVFAQANLRQGMVVTRGEALGEATVVVPTSETPVMGSVAPVQPPAPPPTTQAPSPPPQHLMGRVRAR